ncbi:unnamed protein product, partial [Ectocarpus sp. 8 AP-2014]
GVWRLWSCWPCSPRAIFQTRCRRSCPSYREFFAMVSGAPPRSACRVRRCASSSSRLERRVQWRATDLSWSCTAAWRVCWGLSLGRGLLHGAVW